MCRLNYFSLFHNYVHACLYTVCFRRIKCIYKAVLQRAFLQPCVKAVFLQLNTQVPIPPV